MSKLGAPSIWRLIGADLCRYGSGVSFTSFSKHYLATPGFKYTFWMRLSAYLKHQHWLWRPGYYLCRWILHCYGLRYGISIPYNTKIGPGLYIGHYGGIVINDKVVVGRNCNINHGITIGEKYGRKNSGIPVIGDQVYLGPGCVVIGGISLGNNVAVGANAVVVESIPDFGVAIGIPARMISTNGSTNYIINICDL